MAYWDTSCLLKLYVAEADSPQLQAHAAKGDVIRTSSVTRLELFTAFCRKEAAGGLAAGQAVGTLALYDADVLTGTIAVTPVSPAVTRAFELLVSQLYGRQPAIPLRTLDALHLATADVLGEAEMVTTDKRLRDAALVHGLTVFPP